MKKMGYIIGGFILLPLLIFLVNKVFFQGNEVENKTVKEYLANSTDLNVVIDFDANKPKFEIEDLKTASEGKDDTFGYEIYTAFLSKGGGKIYIDKLTFYGKEYNKFFTIRLTNMGDQFNIYEAIKYINNNVIITVNNDDLKNPKMGTRENPIPVFKVVGNKKPLVIDGKSFEITQSQYENSVYCHLKFVMSKEEFKERFEKK